MQARSCRHIAGAACGRPGAPRRRAVQVHATEQATETYEVTLAKPIGVRFARGNDGAAYVYELDEEAGNTDERFKPGDKVIKVSASFGDDIWDAKNFGQVMYAMKTRNGDIYMELIDRGGDLTCFEEAERTEAQQRYEQERAGGNYGAGTREIQTRNYIAAKEAARKRQEMFNDALEDFRAGKVEDALQVFEEVKAMEPKSSAIDRSRDLARVTNVYRVTLYNIACCYSTLKNTDAALEAIEEAMYCGFEEFQKIRSDKNLEYMRESPKFETTMKEYDQGIINEDAINALKGLFGWGKKK